MAQEEKKIQVLTVALMSLALVAIILVSLIIIKDSSKDSFSQGLKQKDQTITVDEDADLGPDPYMNTLETTPQDVSVSDVFENEILSIDRDLSALEEENDELDSFDLETDIADMENEMNELLSE